MKENQNSTAVEGSKTSTKTSTKTVTKIEQHPTALPRKLRVAAYARVSKETDRLLHSFSEQVSYYNSLIQKNPEWEFAGVFADSGITGTMTKHRSEFQKLMQECDCGRVDLILCKSISRFARNTVDLLSIIRHLKEIGVEVRFEKENISTFSSDGELLLTLLASFAQEESHSISENCKWGIRKRFQNGTIGTANKHILGYRYDEELKRYVVIPEEAKTVRFMFQMFLDGLSFQAIADRLNEAGKKTINGCLFQESSVQKLLYNEVYAGDIVRQKTHTPDPISKVKVKNNGVLPQYLYTDCHEAIIDRATYEKVKAEMERRHSMQHPVYFFTGKIRCECCGGYYSRRKHHHRNGKTYVRWACRHKLDKKTCTSVDIREDTLISACVDTIGADYEQQITALSVDLSGSIHFTLIGGEKRVWKNMRLSTMTHIHTVTDAFQGKIRCNNCGCTYHRVNADNKWCYWYCYGKKKKGVHCDNQNYSDYHLRTITAYVLGTDTFDESLFTDTVDHIEVSSTGDLIYHYKNGGSKTWHRI